MLIYAACLPIWAFTVSPISTVLIYYFRMYGGFTDSELLRRRPNRRLMRNDIFAELYGSFFHDTFQDEPLRFPLK